MFIDEVIVTVKAVMEEMDQQLLEEKSISSSVDQMEEMEEMEEM